MKTLTVITPAYFPSVQTLAVIQAADVVVWADSFQFTKQIRSNRTAIKTVAGAQWLTVPVLSRGRNKQTIADVEIDFQHEWKPNHLKSMQVSYQNSPYYFFSSDELLELLVQDWRRLNKLALASCEFLCRKMRVSFDYVLSSTLMPTRNRSERVANWLKQCQCDTYLLAEHDLAFIDADVIQAHDFSLQTFKTKSIIYHQLFQTYVENLSGLDLLFNEGEMSRSILRTVVQTQRF